MANSITIDIDAKDNASGILGSVFDLVRHGANAFDVLSVAVAGTANFMRQSTKEAFDYDEQIYGLSLSTGQTSEATSRMVQVLDDAGVSFDVVKKAMKEMGKDGIEPNIQELARLSDEFNKLGTGAEKEKFLLDHFGRAGEDLARAMALGRDTILEMNDSINGNLIVTQKAIIEAEKYRKNVDNMNDSWKSFQVGLGNDAIPMINDAFEQLNQNITESGSAVGLLRFGFDDLYRIFTGNVGVTEANTQGTMHYSEAVTDAANAVRDLGGAATLTTDELNDMTKANNSQLSLVKRLQQDTDSYNKSLAEMTEKYGEGSEQVKKLQADHAAAMNSIIYDLYVAKLQAGGFSDAEFDMALKAGVAMGIIDQATADVASSLDSMAQHAVDAGQDVQNIGTYAQALQGQYELVFHSTLTGNWPNGSYGGGGSGGGGAGNGGPGGSGPGSSPTFAAGGSTDPYGKPSIVLVEITQNSALMIGDSVAKAIEANRK